MEGQFKPLGDRVLVKPQEKTENKTASGIILLNHLLNHKKYMGK